MSECRTFNYSSGDLIDMGAKRRLDFFSCHIENKTPFYNCTCKAEETNIYSGIE